MTRDQKHAAEARRRGGEGVVIEDLGAQTLDEIRAHIAADRAAGAIVVGCSFCAENKPRDPGWHPCPVCDTLCSSDVPAPVVGKVDQT